MKPERRREGDVEAARAEAQRRIERREAHAEHVRQLGIYEDQIAAIERLLAAGMPIADAALRAELARLREACTTTQIAIHSTGWRSWGMDESHVRARDGEGLTETTWRVLIDRGARGYQIARLVDETKDSALRKRMDRWRMSLIDELEEWRAELRAHPHPWARINELLGAAESMLARIA